MPPRPTPTPPALSGWRALFGPGVGGLLFLAVLGVGVAWQATRVAVIDPDAPLPREVPASALLGSMATLPAPAPGPEARMAAPTPAPDASDDARIEREVSGGR